MVSSCDLVCNSMITSKLELIFIFMLLFPDESIYKQTQFHSETMFSSKNNTDWSPTSHVFCPY